MSGPPKRPDLEPVATGTPSKRIRWIHFGVVRLFQWAGLLATGLFVANNCREQEPVTENPVPVPKKRTYSFWKFETSKEILEENLEAARAERKNVLDHAAQVKVLLNRWIDISSSLYEQKTSLLTNPVGRTIAANPELLPEVELVLKRIMRPNSEIAARSTQLDEIVRPIEQSQAREGDLSLPPRDTIRKLDELAFQLDEETKACSKVQAQLKEIIKKADATGRMVGYTLKEKLDEFHGVLLKMRRRQEAERAYVERKE